MCDFCGTIILRDRFYSPRDYQNCLTYLQKLLDTGGCALVEGSCDLSHTRDEAGHWADDVIVHTIQCTHCGQRFTCCADTYHGTGSFQMVR